MTKATLDKVLEELTGTGRVRFAADAAESPPADQAGILGREAS